MRSWTTTNLGYCAYQELGVDEHDDTATIRAAYRRLAVRHHPDRGGSAARFLRIHSAWEATRDAGYRLDHQRSLACACRIRTASTISGSAGHPDAQSSGDTTRTSPKADERPATPTSNLPSTPRREPPTPPHPAPQTERTRRRAARRPRKSRTASPGRLDLRPRDLVFLIITVVLNAGLELAVFAAVCIGLVVLVSVMLVSGRQATRTAKALKIVAFAVMAITVVPLVLAIALLLLLFGVAFIVLFALW